MRSGSLSRLGFGLSSTVLAGLLVQGTAQAAPGDAGARGVELALRADVAGDVVIGADAAVGAADAPVGGGTDTGTALDVAAGLPPRVGVSATGTVQEVTATRGAAASSATATVAGVTLGILGTTALRTGQVTAAARCPASGPSTADTTVAGLQLFGTPVTVGPSGPAATATAAVTADGLDDARLTVTVRQVETVTAPTPTAAALRATLTLTGSADGAPVSVPVGTVTIASATCTRPTAPPTATGITPDRGPAAGGQRVTILGTGFVAGSTTVTFDGVPATGVVVAPGGTSLTAITPVGGAGPAAVVVTTAAGDSGPVAYTYVAAPTLSGPTPDEGPVAGGTTVTITGSGLAGTTAVTVDGSSAAILSRTATSVVVRAPAHPAGTVDVAVTTPGGTDMLPAAFTYVPPAAAPTATAITPDTGPTAGGRTVTITGTGFVPGDTTVTFDGIPATDVVVAPGGTSLTAVTPAGVAGPATVVVSTPADSGGPLAYTYVGGAAEDPAVTGIDPAELPTSGGVTVTITGTGLGGVTRVDFGGTPGTDLQVSADGTSLTVTAPARETAGGTAVEVGFADGTVAAPAVAYVAPDVDLVATGVGPSTGGTRVEIRGTNLEAATGVTFDGRPGRIVQRAEPVATVSTPGPAGFAGSAPGSALLAGSAPALSAVSAPGSVLSAGSVPGSAFFAVSAPGPGPAAGPAGPSAGAGEPAGSVLAVAPRPILLADVVLVAITPPGAVGPADIRVVLPGRDAMAANGFRYIPPVVLSALTPAAGPPGGGQTVLIAGSGFSSGTPTVSFDGVPAAQLLAVDDDTLLVVTPPGTAGPADVVVTVAGVASARRRYTYLSGAALAAAPTAAGLDPATGPTGGGTGVTVTGSGFVRRQTSVLVCGTTLLPGAVEVTAGGESLSFVTPACDAGPQDVTIVTPGGTTGGLTFTYSGGGPGAGSGVGGDGRLADTGADVAGLVRWGIVALLLGAVLSRRARRLEDALA